MIPGKLYCISVRVHSDSHGCGSGEAVPVAKHCARWAGMDRKKLRVLTLLQFFKLLGVTQFDSDT